MEENKVLKKLKLTGQDPVLIINAPEEFEPVSKDIQAEIRTESVGKFSFIMVFVKSCEEAEKYLGSAVDSLDGDSLLWVAYPKKSSKKYKSDINRDWSWSPIAEKNYEPVTMIAIDDDWSALRFRQIENIKTMSRKFAISDKGKERIKENL